jgi:hypothetical protein
LEPQSILSEVGLWEYHFHQGVTVLSNLGYGWGYEMTTVELVNMEGALQ